ncbi:MAG: PorP/SprF family type IX secretion system membrane protein [Paludibacteraceae bacterium]|nr:PorP/SprF family type IX secretion system membrane protein [Candidatus Physcocola equi]MCQ2234121.1 PorP/SprF family type IX secretion system membrane protein [Paludibacteraceae bacterium]
MKKILIFVSALFMALSAAAQQDLMLTQQFFSRVNKNPAGIGNIADLDVFLLGRYQWASMDDSPKSGVLNVQTFRDNLHSGFAVSMAYDNLGVAKQMFNPKLAYAYQFNLNDELVLSLGLAAGLQYGYFDAAKYTLEDESERSDGDFPDDKQTKFSPDFDFGAEIVSPQFLVGASVTHLAQNESTTLMNSRHIYVYGRYLFNINEHFDVAPMVSWMNKEKVNVTELNVTGFYNRLFWGGLTWHPDLVDGLGSNPVAVSAGLEFLNFRIGYTFDYNFGKVAKYAGNAHELYISYSVRNKQTAPDYERFE